jgi:hypothetical protein
MRNKKWGHMNNNIYEFKTDNKNKNSRDTYKGIHEFRKGYQPRLLKDENRVQLADFNDVLNR